MEVARLPPISKRETPFRISFSGREYFIEAGVYQKILSDHSYWTPSFVLGNSLERGLLHSIFRYSSPEEEFIYDQDTIKSLWRDLMEIKDIMSPRADHIVALPYQSIRKPPTRASFSSDVSLRIRGSAAMFLKCVEYVNLGDLMFECIQEDDEEFILSTTSTSMHLLCGSWLPLLFRFYSTPPVEHMWWLFYCHYKKGNAGICQRFLLNLYSRKHIHYLKRIINPRTNLHALINRYGIPLLWERLLDHFRKGEWKDGIFVLPSHEDGKLIPSPLNLLYALTIVDQYYFLGDEAVRILENLMRVNPGRFPPGEIIPTSGGGKIFFKTFDDIIPILHDPTLLSDDLARRIMDGVFLSKPKIYCMPPGRTPPPIAPMNPFSEQGDSMMFLLQAVEGLVTYLGPTLFEGPPLLFFDGHIFPAGGFPHASQYHAVIRTEEGLERMAFDHLTNHFIPSVVGKPPPLVDVVVSSH